MDFNLRQHELELVSHVYLSFPSTTSSRRNGKIYRPSIRSHFLSLCLYLLIAMHHIASFILFVQMTLLLLFGVIKRITLSNFNVRHTFPMHPSIFSSRLKQKLSSTDGEREKNFHNITLTAA